MEAVTTAVKSPPGSSPGGWLLTYSGRRVSLTTPRPEDVEFRDIAHALANLCRFGGHASRYYSVAEHSVLVSHAVPKKLALLGLMHDAHEAYVGDMVTPLKKMVPEIAGLARVWDDAISARFGFQLNPVRPEIKEADLVVLYHELQCLFPAGTGDFVREMVPEGLRLDGRALGAQGPREVMGLPPKLAEELFIDRCLQLLKNV